MPQASQRFLEILKNKLSYGSTRSILLNCLPGRTGSRLGINEVDLLKKDFSSSFVDQLCSSPDFDIKIPILLRTPKSTDPPLIKQALEEENLKKSKIERKLVNIKYDHDDILKEHGIETFGFGFPILVRRNPADPTSIIVAPLLIWPLDIRQDFDKSKTWTISRKAEKGIQVNEALRSFLKSEQQVDMPTLPESATDDGIIDKTELETFIHSLKGKLNISNPGMHQWNYLDVIPERVDLEKETQGQSRIIFSGVFGIYKSQKQSLINDLNELIQQMQDQADSGNINNSFPMVWGHTSTPIQVDPSQHSVVRSLAQKDSIVIQGPPGTGKSQTLTAIIATALSDRKKVLVVCEKRTALEVIRQNMVRQYPFLERAIALIEDVSSDRNLIVKKARERETQPDRVSMATGMVAAFKKQYRDFEDRIALADNRYKELLEPLHGNLLWMDGVAEWIQMDIDASSLPELEWMVGRMQKMGLPTHEGDTRSTLARLYQLFLLSHEKLDAYDELFCTAIETAELPSIPKKLRSLSFELKMVFDELDPLLKRYGQLCLDHATQQQDTCQQEAQQLADRIRFVSPFLANPYEATWWEKFKLIFNSQKSKILQAAAEATILCQNIQEQYGKLGKAPLDAALADTWVKTFTEQRGQLIADFMAPEYASPSIKTGHLSAQETDKWNNNIRELDEIFHTLMAIFNMAHLSYSGHPLQVQMEKWEALKAFMQEQSNNEAAIQHYLAWREALALASEPVREVVRMFMSRQKEDWSITYRKLELYAMLSKAHQEHRYPEHEHHLHEILALQQELKKKQDIMIHDNIMVWFNDGLMKYEGSQTGFRKLFNLRGANGESRNSLRRIIHQDTEAFTDMHPLILANPGAVSSLFPLQSDLFDLVIFDEASQLRIEDTFSSLLRGKSVIVSGDSQQMPPSSYFESSRRLDYVNAEDEDLADEELLMEELDLEMANRESLLEWAIDEGYSQTYLDMHYRSRHPDLIAFSNTCFYGSRLIPMPGTIKESPIVFKQVDGTYAMRMNEQEADEVIQLLRREIPANKSVGVATFNLVQRNLILDKINKLRYEDAQFHAKMTALDQQGFFVKNLENIQGDERDIIIMSTTFGASKDGAFRMSFGPISQKNGYRLLNVIITRAKERMYVLTSIPQHKQLEYKAQLEQDKRVSGKSGLLAYLIYCCHVSQGNAESKLSLLQEIKSFLEAGNQAMINLQEKSSFEEGVAKWLGSIFGSESVQTKYACGGFVIDLAFTHPQTGVKLALVTDGAAYHSNELFWHNDAYRQEQLEKEGYRYIRLWTAAWWRNREAEQQKLLEILSRG